MKLADNTGTSVPMVKQQLDQTGSVNMIESFSTDVTSTAYSQQSELVPEAAQGGDLTYAFYAVGMVINLALISAYFIWAYRQWKKKASKE